MAAARTPADAFRPGTPKRILALASGDIRGLLPPRYLSRINELLRARSPLGKDFRLAHYFDLIAGTSTGAIIAAALATGMTADEVSAKYLKLGREVFSGKNWFSKLL